MRSLSWFIALPVILSACGPSHTVTQSLTHPSDEQVTDLAHVPHSTPPADIYDPSQKKPPSHPKLAPDEVKIFGPAVVRNIDNPPLIFPAPPKAPESPKANTSPVTPFEKEFKSVGVVSHSETDAVHVCTGTITDGNVVYTAKHCLSKEMQNNKTPCKGKLFFHIANPSHSGQIDVLSCDRIISQTIDTLGKENLSPDAAAFIVDTKGVNYPTTPVSKKPFKYQDYLDPQNKLYALTSLPLDPCINGVCDSAKTLRTCTFKLYSSYLFDFTGTSDPMITMNCDVAPFDAGNSGSGIVNSAGELVAIVDGDYEDGKTFKTYRSTQYATNIHYVTLDAEKLGLIRSYITDQQIKKISYPDWTRVRLTNFLKYDLHVPAEDEDFEYFAKKYVIEKDKLSTVQAFTAFKGPTLESDHFDLVLLIPKCFKNTSPPKSKTYNSPFYLNQSTNDRYERENIEQFYPLGTSDQATINTTYTSNHYTYEFVEVGTATHSRFLSTGIISHCAR